MKVIFLDNVEGTATVGEVKDVKNGFARNYLLPRGLAAPAIEPYLTRGAARAKVEEKRQADLDKDATGLAARIEGAKVRIEAKVGEQGKLYGSVTSVHIAAEVAKLLGDEEFDHRKVLLPESIKEVGVQPVRLRLTRNVEATIEVEVYSEEQEDEPAVEASAATETAVEEAEALDEAAGTEADAEAEEEEAVE
jgi:large subunit ribosomal protein L9